MRQLAGAAQGTDTRERNALSDAVREIEEQRLSQQMRSAVRAEQKQPGAGAEREKGEKIARGLDRLADRLGAAGGQSEDSERLTEELSRIRQLREELAGLDRQLSELRGRSGDPNGAARGRSGQPGSGAQEGGARGAVVQGSGVQSGGVQNGDAQAPWQTARDLLNELRRENRNRRVA